MARNAEMLIANLIMTLCEIAYLGQGDAMELGAVDAGERGLEHEMAKVYTGGKIGMSTSFDSMREFLDTLDEVVPKNAFLRKWLRRRLQKGEHQEGQRHGRNQYRGRVGRGGYQGNAEDKGKAAEEP